MALGEVPHPPPPPKRNMNTRASDKEDGRPTRDEALLLPVVPGGAGETAVAAEPAGVTAGEQVFYTSTSP
jgi:hypothetical protein